MLHILVIMLCVYLENGLPLGLFFSTLLASVPGYMPLMFMVGGESNNSNGESVSDLIGS